MTATDELLCPLCKVPMLHRKAMDFWKCPACPGEFWPNDPNATAIHPRQPAEQISRSFHGFAKRPSNNDSTGRAKKRKAALATERYKLE